MSSLRVDLSGRIGLIEINRPAVANALDLRTMRALAEAMVEVGRCEACAAVVITAAGEKHFCAGADRDDPHVGSTEVRDALLEMIVAIVSCPKPVVAGVGGAAVGAGAMIALLVDRCVVTGRAQLSLPELSLGIAPPIAFDLARFYFGAAIARDLVVSLRKLDAQSCVELRAAEAIVPQSDLCAEALAHAETLAALPPAGIAVYKNHLADRVCEALGLQRQVAR